MRTIAWRPPPSSSAPATIGTKSKVSPALSSSRRRGRAPRMSPLSPEAAQPGPSSSGARHGSSTGCPAGGHPPETARRPHRSPGNLPTRGTPPGSGVGHSTGSPASAHPGSLRNSADLRSTKALAATAGHRVRRNGQGLPTTSPPQQPFVTLCLEPVKLFANRMCKVPSPPARKRQRRRRRSFCRSRSARWSADDTRAYRTVRKRSPSGCRTNPHAGSCVSAPPMHENVGIFTANQCRPILAGSSSAGKLPNDIICRADRVVRPLARANTDRFMRFPVLCIPPQYSNQPNAATLRMSRLFPLQMETGTMPFDHGRLPGLLPQPR